jgi:DNA-directed RNA polymerase specialized sigma24 family protein
MADRTGRNEVELDWSLLRPTIAVAVRRTRAIMNSKCGSAQAADEIEADYMAFLWTNREKYDPAVAAQNTWAEAFLRNRSMQVVSEYRLDAARYVSLDVLSGHSTPHSAPEFSGPDPEIPDHTAADPAAAVESREDAIAEMLRSLNGDPVAQLCFLELVDPCPEVQAARAAYDERRGRRSSIVPTEAIASVYDLHRSIVSIAISRVRAILSGEQPATSPAQIRTRSTLRPEAGSQALLLRPHVATATAQEVRHAA